MTIAGEMALILVTGANGFVGHALCKRLNAEGRSFAKVVRRIASLSEIVVGEIGSETDWRGALDGCESVVHLAARVHIMHDDAMDPLADFRRVNVEGTINLARQAAQAGVRRFVFLSSIKVNGELGRFYGVDQASPQDPYAISKLEAEQGLHQIAAETGMEVVVLRPPLVYGPGVGANFLRLMRAVDQGLPLPFGLVDNCRSLIYLGNLVDAISVCLNHPAAVGKTYHVSDGEDVSTRELVRRLAKALQRPSRLIPVPKGFMKFCGRMLGKKQEMDRLLGSLTVDISPISSGLGWMPPFSMREGLAHTANWYHQNKPHVETSI